MESRKATIDELAPLVSGQRAKDLLETGDLECGIHTAGQVLGLVRDIPTVEGLIDSIMRDANEVVSGMGVSVVFQPLRTTMLTNL